MRLRLNGEDIETESEITVESLLARLEIGSRRVAVAVNGQVSPRSEHADRKLCDGDDVEVIHAVAGG
jgi:sulfur carrier protein